MSGYLIDPKVVNAFLDKPYNLRDVWDRVAGDNPPAGMSAPEDKDIYYTDAEKQLIEDELDRLYAELTQGRNPAVSARRDFTLSAGAPGAGKSTLLENLILQNEDLNGAVFADPDERALKLMKVYKEDIETFGGGPVGLALSYTKWRWGSNYISGSIMNRACADGYNVLHGTTATSPAVSILYDNAHNEGFDITTLIVAAPEDVRVESARRRFEQEQTRFTNDTAEKGKLFYERVPLFFEKTDNFKLYWREAAQGEPVLAASGVQGAITIENQAALDAIEKDLQSVKPDLSWDQFSQAYTGPKM